MFKRLSLLLRGFMSLFISDIERQNPEALLEVVKEDLRKQVSRYNQGLASHAGLVERLSRQVKEGEARERELRARAAANLKAGNQKLAGEVALELQNCTARLTEDKAQLAQSEKTYVELTKARDVTVNEAKQKIESLKYKIGDMKVKKATAELTEMASGMISSIGGSGDTLNRLDEIVNEESEKASGRARVAKDSLNTYEFQMKEEEHNALAAQALADFAAAEGIAIDAPAMPQDTGVTTQKSMGTTAVSA